MKHSEETIKAAEAHRGYTNHFSSKDDFLAGVEHAQKDIQELHDALGHAKGIIERLVSDKPVRNLDENLAWYDKLIQKHRQ